MRVPQMRQLMLTARNASKPGKADCLLQIIRDVVAEFLKKSLLIFFLFSAADTT